MKFMRYTLILLILTCTLSLTCDSDDKKDPISFRIKGNAGQFTGSYSINASENSMEFQGEKGSYEIYEYYAKIENVEYLEIDVKRNDKETAILVTVYKDNKKVGSGTLPVDTSDSAKYNISISYTYEDSDSTDDNPVSVMEY